MDEQKRVPADGSYDVRSVATARGPVGRTQSESARLPMVAWGSVEVLQQAAVRAFLAPLFGRFSDKRDTIAALDPVSAVSASSAPDANGDVWIDVVSDTGEGFDSTYTVARTVSEPTLTALDPDGRRHETVRGSLLLLGGDEVYPYAEPGAYRDRFEGPWSQALQEGTVTGQRVCALPGNHDWYDGLTCFLETFRKGRSIGARQVDQSRSYFAAPLTKGWWALAIDLQFTDSIDAAQADYFRRVAKAADTPMRVILMVPEPAWVYDDIEGRELSKSKMAAIERFEREILFPRHTLEVVLTGDLHHYSRYTEVAADSPPIPDAPEPRPGRPWITFGGGGAHLRGTHDLAATIRPIHRARFGPLQREHVWPSASTTRLRSAKALLLGWISPTVATLCGVLAVLLAWSLDFNLAIADAQGLRATASTFFRTIIHHPASTLLTAGILVSMILAADVVARPVKWLIGAVHAGAHLTLLVFLLDKSAEFSRSAGPSRWFLGGAGAAALLAGARRLLRAPIHEGLPDGLARQETGWGRFTRRLLSIDVLGFAVAGVALLAMAGFAWGSHGPGTGAESPLARSFWLRAFALLFLGAAVGHSTLLGLYLALMSAIGARHVGPALACQAIPDWKGFLRLKIDDEGALTIYPIGVPKVRRTWAWSQSSGRFEPEGAIPGAPATPVAPVELIDRPIRIP